jgi:aspartate racemase
VVKPESRDAYRAVIERLVDRGAQGIIYGCTEISLLVGPQDSAVPVFDTTAIHARHAAELAISSMLTR